MQQNVFPVFLLKSNVLLLTAQKEKKKKLQHKPPRTKTKKSLLQNVAFLLSFGSAGSLQTPQRLCKGGQNRGVLYSGIKLCYWLKTR